MDEESVEVGEFPGWLLEQLSARRDIRYNPPLSDSNASSSASRNLSPQAGPSSTSIPQPSPEPATRKDAEVPGAAKSAPPLLGWGRRRGETELQREISELATALSSVTQLFCSSDCDLRRLPGGERDVGRRDAETLYSTRLALERLRSGGSGAPPALRAVRRLCRLLALRLPPTEMAQLPGILAVATQLAEGTLTLAGHLEANQSGVHLKSLTNALQRFAQRLLTPLSQVSRSLDF